MSEHETQPESPYQKFFWILAAACLGLLGTGISAVVYQASTNATVSARLSAIENQLSDIAHDVKSGTSNRYTAQDAVSDRKTYMDAMTSLATSIASRMDVLANKNNSQDDAIQRLLEFKARTEAIMGKGGNGQ